MTFPPIEPSSLSFPPMRRGPNLDERKIWLGLQNIYAERIVADWKDWTPTYTNLTVGDGTVIARYVQVGKIVHVYWHFTLGSTSAMGTGPRISMPVTETTNIKVSNQTLGTVWILDSGTTNHLGQLRHRDTSTFEPLVTNAAATYVTAAALSATIPMTWTTSDTLSFQSTYEAA